MGLICCCSLPPSSCPTCPNYTAYFGPPTPPQPIIHDYTLRIYPPVTEEIRELKEKMDELMKEIRGLQGSAKIE